MSWKQDAAQEAEGEPEKKSRRGMHIEANAGECVWVEEIPRNCTAGNGRAVKAVNLS
jgi:hypothetical protein